MKISCCADKRMWELLAQYGEDLIHTRFGRLIDSPADMKEIADEICWRGIKAMLDVLLPPTALLMHLTNAALQLGTSNQHHDATGLDRVIAFGHSISLTLELAPVIPLRHGHAVRNQYPGAPELLLSGVDLVVQINIDMAFFVTFACSRGHLTEQERDEYHKLSHRVGLSMDHGLLTEKMILEGTQAIL